MAGTFLGGEPDPLRHHQRDNVRVLFGVGDSVTRILAPLHEEIAGERGATDIHPTN